VVLQLRPGDLKSRIVDLFRIKEEELLNCEENSEIVNLSGYIGKPGLARKTRGHQFLFANGRYIRDPYLSHAVGNAYSGLIEDGEHPFYMIFLSVNPAKIDVNIHPTKAEVKFEDARHVYSVLQSVVRKSLSRYFSIPSLQQVQNSVEKSSGSASVFQPRSPNPRYNPFEPSKERVKTEWEKLDELLRPDPLVEREIPSRILEVENQEEGLQIEQLFQLLNKFVVVKLEEEIWLVHQNRAHEQILFERYSKSRSPMPSQQLLFPRTLELSASDFQIYQDLELDIRNLGFDTSIFGKQAVIINGLPTELSKEDGSNVLEQIIQDYKSDFQKLKLSKRDALMKATAKNTAIKAGKILSEPEMRRLINDLLQGDQHNVNAKGAAIVIKLNKESLERFFQGQSRT
jgi:DNA mismatch repair protein MutL